jgi:hypothetical protein
MNVRSSYPDILYPPETASFYQDDSRIEVRVLAEWQRSRHICAITVKDNGDWHLIARSTEENLANLVSENNYRFVVSGNKRKMQKTIGDTHMLPIWGIDQKIFQ